MKKRAQSMGPEEAAQILNQACGRLTLISKHPSLPDGRYITNAEQVSMARKALYMTAGAELKEEDATWRRELKAVVQGATQTVFLGNPFAIIGAIALSFGAGAHDGNLEPLLPVLAWLWGGSMLYLYAFFVPRFKYIHRLSKGDAPAGLISTREAMDSARDFGDWMQLLFVGLLLYSLFIPVLALVELAKNRPWEGW